MLKEIYKGNTVAFTALPTVDGVVAQIQGELRFILKKNRTDPDPEAVLTKVSSDGQFQIEASETEAIEAGWYVYEFRWIFNSVVHTLEMGQVTVAKAVYD